jgi:hypothetical protein
MYSIELGYGDDFRGSDRRFNVSITDGQAGPISGGVSFTYTTARPRFSTDDRLRLEGYRIDGALAVRANERLSVGVGIRGAVYDLENEDESTSQNAGTLTFDVGLQWKITDAIAIGLVGRNLTDPDEPEFALEAGGGIGFGSGPFTLEVDAIYDNAVENVIGSVGSTLVLGEIVPLRVGLLYDADQEELGVGGGAGIQVGRIGIDVAYQQRVTNANDFRDDDERIFTASVFLIPF